MNIDFEKMEEWNIVFLELLLQNHFFSLFHYSRKLKRLIM